MYEQTSEAVRPACVVGYHKSTGWNAASVHKSLVPFLLCVFRFISLVLIAEALRYPGWS